MKKFLIVAGLLTVIATPAFAQSFDPDMGTGNNLPFAYGQQIQDSAHGAFAKADTKAPANAPASENYDEGRGNLGGSVHNGYVVDGY